MKIVTPSFVELNDDKLFTKLERCGRVCYKSEDKITDDSSYNFVKKICANNHGSVLEHYSLLFKISEDYYNTLKNENLAFFVLTNINQPLVSFNVRAFVNYYNNNEKEGILLPIINYMEENYGLLFDKNHPVSNTKVERITDFSSLKGIEKDKHMRVTIKVVTDRGVSHELVRHRMASFSQESTRYCNYSKDKFGNEITVIKPVGLEGEVYDIWYEAMKNAETSYFKMLEKGATAQMARSVLPNSLKTEICITASVEEWKLIFDLRCSPFAHPDCVATMTPIQEYFKKKGYID